MNLEDRIQEIRSDFPITHYRIFLDNCAISPISNPVVSAMQGYLETRKLYPLKGVMEQHIVWDGQVKAARTEAAKLINANEDEIAFTVNTTQGIATAASVIDWKKGDNVILNDLEFPGNVMPWMYWRKKGVETRFVKNVEGRIQISDIESQIDENTRVIAISWVQWTNGFKSNLRELSSLADQHDILLFVDGVQGVGAIKLDVKSTGIHMMSTGGHKWLCAPYGSGFLYCRQDLIERYETPYVGARSPKPSPHGLRAYEQEDLDNFEYCNKGIRTNAQRFENPGSPIAPSMYGFSAALKYINDLGSENIESRVIQLTNHLIDLLEKNRFTVVTPKESGNRSGIVSFKGNHKLVEYLLTKNIVVSMRYTGGQGGVRISPHFYNTFEEIEKLVNEAKLWRD